MKTPPKGKDLEQAVRLLQETLLKSDPSLKGGKFTIEVNKQKVIEGTRHEVDVYVVTNPGTHYESVILFECKDWIKPVSKNEVMNLKEKVDLFGANRGILVAHRLSKDAAALLTKYNRIEYQPCTQDVRELFGLDVLHTVHDPVRTSASVMSRWPDITFPTNFLHTPCRWYERLSLFEAVVRERVDSIVQHDQKHSCGKYLGESVHWFEAHDILDFNEGEFFLGEIELATLQISVAYFVSAAKSKPRYQCSINGAGQVHFFEVENPDFPNGRISINVAFTPNSKSQ